MPDSFDRLHLAARQIPAFQRLAVISRILLAVAFIPTGLVKLLGRRFTLIGPESAIGAFFEAMYQTGVYWHFLGLGQVTAGVLLLIPATRTLGAVMFFPIILNVTVITWSLNFTGTIYITALMLVANVFLLCWDYDRLRSIIFRTDDQATIPPAAPMPRVEKVGYVIGTTAALVVLLALRSLVPTSIVRWMLLAALVAAAMVLTGWIQAGRPRPEQTGE